MQFRKLKFHFYLLISIAVGVVFILCGSLSSSPQTTDSKPSLYPPTTLKYFTLGYNEIVADGMWLRTIQDFDYCENKKTEDARPGTFSCSRGWVFHMIDSVTELAPHFRQPYLSGAVMLSILVNDISGASAIFDKGVAAFPHDSQILYNAAYQAMFEEHNDPKASLLLVASGKSGAPPWVFSLAAKLQQKSGRLEFAKSILMEAKDLSVSGPGSQRIQQRLDEVNKELAAQPKQ